MADSGALLGQYMPGDMIRANLEITVPMNLMAVSVLFEHVDDPDRAIELRSTFDEILDRQHPESPYVLQVEAPAALDIPPGLYRLYRVVCLTYSGKSIRIEGDPLGDLRHNGIEIIPEPTEHPHVTGFEFTDD